MDMCPYKGLVPYEEEDARYLFGRDTERRIIADNLKATRLTVLYGPSGAGKTSVLRAGVAYDLRADPEYRVLVFDAWHDNPAASLEAAIRQQLGIAENSAPLQAGGSESCLSLLGRWSESANSTLLIVLDQFEEYFQYHVSGIDDSFAFEFPRLVNSRDLGVHFLLCVREDCLSFLDRFKAGIPGLLDNRLSIGFLSQKAACDAIVKPLGRLKRALREGELHAPSDKPIPVEIDEAVAQGVVEQILTAQGGETQEVQASYLQLVLTRWWGREAMRGSRVMSWGTLEKEMGGVQHIVEIYVKDTLATLTPDDMRLVNEAFGEMLTPAGGRVVKTWSQLAAVSTDRERLSRLLEQLLTAKILAMVAPPRESRPDERRYEFAHDVVAKAALEWREQGTTGSGWQVREWTGHFKSTSWTSTT